MIQLFNLITVTGSRNVSGIVLLYYIIIISNSIIHVGTHDIQNVTVSSPLPGQIRVTGEFVDGFTATALLLIIYSLNNDSNVHYIDEHKEQGSVSVVINFMASN